MKRIKILPVITLGLAMLTASCVYDPHYYGSPPYHDRPGYYPYDYYYYPSAHVYFQYSTGYYHFLQDGRWLRSRVLPSRFRLNPQDRVFLRSESDKPYQQHNKHIKQYRPRPNLKLTPDKDRRERETHRKTYKEQMYYKQQNQIEQNKGKREKREKREKDKNRR